MASSAQFAPLASAGTALAPSNTIDSASLGRILHDMTPALLAGLGYYVGTIVGFALTPQGQPHSLLWMPNAILLAAFLVAERRLWWTLVVAVFPVHMFAQLHAGVPAWMAAGWFVTNVSEALVGAFCITRFVRPTRLFATARGVLVFAVFGILVAPLATSFLDAAAVVLTGWGHGFVPMGAERFWTNALAELIIVPNLLLSTTAVSEVRKPSLAKFCEAGVVALVAIAVTVWVFRYQPVMLSATPIPMYVPLLVLLWATARFGVSGLSPCLLFIALTGSWYQMHGWQPFPHASIQHNILWFQMLLSLGGLPLLFLAATVTESRHTQESLRRVAGELINAQEQERHSIARELHDGLSQQLSLGLVKIDMLIQKSDESLKLELADVAETLSAISTTTHEISHGLYPSNLAYLGLASALKRLCDDSRQGKPTIQLTLQDVPPKLSQDISLCLYRIAQEGIRNAVSHGQAKSVLLNLEMDGRWICLRIVDDGVGFNVRQRAAGLGLVSMSERVLLVGGSIDISSTRVSGTRIEVRIPYQEDGSDRPDPS